jgi:enoyl-CoA hydratase/carnithine racemase
MSPLKVEFDARARLAILSLADGLDSPYLSEQTCHELADSLGSFKIDARANTICLAGPSDRFLMGADVEIFRRAIDRKAVGDIVDFTTKAHAVLNQISESAKTTVAWIRGPAVGAGLEVALACHKLVAATNAKFSMPETGLGIYPGMGGTQRLPRRIGVGLAKWMIYTGSIVPAEHALDIGLVDVLIPTDFTAPQAVAALASAPPATLARQLPERFAMLEQLFANHSLSELLDPAFPAPADPQAVRALVQLRSKAPVALRRSEQLIDRGLGLPLAAGLELELAHLAEIFSTEDARIGLASIGQARPRFLGR